MDDESFIVNKKCNSLILAVMKDAFTIPDNFDESLPDEVINDFYSDQL